ncbi:hypothetical protein BaRGS_00024909, partial [Batillaria attramentaria]
MRATPADAGYMHHCAGAHFEFPTLVHKVLRTNENTTVSFPFKIVSENCSSRDDQLQTVQVARHGSQNDHEILCYVFHQQGKCLTSQRISSCTCSSDTELFQFNHTVTRSDNTEWRWSSSSVYVQDATVNFEIA